MTSQEDKIAYIRHKLGEMQLEREYLEEELDKLTGMNASQFILWLRKQFVKQYSTERITSIESWLCDLIDFSKNKFNEVYNKKYKNELDIKAK